MHIVGLFIVCMLCWVLSFCIWTGIIGHIAHWIILRAFLFINSICITLHDFLVLILNYSEYNNYFYLWSGWNICKRHWQASINLIFCCSGVDYVKKTQKYENNDTLKQQNTKHMCLSYRKCVLFLLLPNCFKLT